MKNLDTYFVLEKKIACPEKSELLAEFMGLVIGDGHVSQY
jgi:hypothetical protein